MGYVGSLTQMRHNRAVTRLAELGCVSFWMQAGRTCFHGVKLHILMAFQIYCSIQTQLLQDSDIVRMGYAFICLRDFLTICYSSVVTLKG